VTGAFFWAWLMRLTSRCDFLCPHDAKKKPPGGNRANDRGLSFTLFHLLR
jgi:hypothetical protein